ncbi:MAG TPA: hypothetical protein VFW09_05250 [Solirubrobacteraceae bacterium]|nr:hypothetical protein [Solirubrobacteraceae bacterium]
MIPVARLLSRLVGLLLLTLVAAVGIVAAVFCIQGDHGTLSLPRLAAHLRLPQLRDNVGSFFDQVTAPGPVAIIAVLCGLAAVALGLLLLVGAWVSSRPRRIVFERTPEGSLQSLRRPLGRLAAERAAAPAEVSTARARARAARAGAGGRLRVSGRAATHVDRRRAQASAAASVAQLTADLPLRTRITMRRPGRRRTETPR